METIGFKRYSYVTIVQIKNEILHLFHIRDIQSVDKKYSCKNLIRGEQSVHEG